MSGEGTRELSRQEAIVFSVFSRPLALARLSHDKLTFQSYRA